MAFQPENFLPGRGIFYADTPSSGAAINTYISTMDSTSTILTAGYFPAYYGATADDISDADYLWITGTNDTVLVRMKNTATSPTFVVALSYYYLAGTFSLTFGGPWASSITQTCNYSIRGSEVDIYIPLTAATAPSNQQITSGFTTIPSNIRPLSVYYKTLPVLNSSTQDGYLNVDNSTGFVTIQPFGAFGSGSATYGFYSTVLSYIYTTTLP